jgi:hypothetical protein
MKKLSIVLSLAIVLVSCSGNSQNKLKRYNVESGIVEYSISTTGKMLGSKISGKGTKHLYFKNYGIVELQEEESSQTSVMKFFGKEKKETTTTHTMSKIQNGKNYIVDFENEQITVGAIPGMELIEEGKDAAQTGKEMLIAMGGEKIGDESFKGYNCEVWTVLGGKQWIYKGVMLKMEMNTLGIQTMQEAVNVDFNVSVADDKFELPNFTVQESETILNSSEYKEGMEDMDAGMDKVANMSYEEWKKAAVANDEEMKAMSDEELRQTYDMIQQVIKMRNGN